MRHAFIILVALAFFTLQPKDTQSQVVSVNELEGKTHLFFTERVNVLKTTTNIRLDSVFKLDPSKFERINHKSVVFSGHDSYFYWFRFTIRNEDTLDRKLMVLLGPLGVRKAELFQQKNGVWSTTGKTGNHYPFIQRAYIYAHYAFPVTISGASTEEFYLSMDFGNEYRSYAFVLMSPTALKTFENRLYLTFGIITGFLLLYAFINLYLFFALKQKIHFWYFLYVIMLLIIVLKNDQLDEEFFGLDSERGYRLMHIMSVAAIAIALLMHVIQLFTYGVTAGTYINKVTTFIKYNLFISGIVYLVLFNITVDHELESIMFYWANWSAIVGIVFILIHCGYSIYKGLKTTWIIIAGLAVFFIGALERLLLSGTPSYLFPPYLFHIGMILETTILSYALIYRYKTQRREQSMYAKEKEQLKNMYERKILETRLEMQEQTFKYISQEIHDNIGQILSLTKLTLNSIQSTDENLNKTIGTSKTLVTSAIRELRDLSKTFNTEFLVELGLIKSIEMEVSLLNKRGHLKIDFKVIGEPFHVIKQQELILFRIFQDALNHIAKYSYGKELVSEVEFNNAGLTIKISHTCNCITFQHIESQELMQTVASMKSRASLIGAELYACSDLRSGEIFSIHLPSN